MMCGESCGDGNILTVGEIRSSKDTSVMFPSQLGGNKGLKMSTKPRAAQLRQTSFDEIFLLRGLNE